GHCRDFCLAGPGWNDNRDIWESGAHSNIYGCRVAPCTDFLMDRGDRLFPLCVLRAFAVNRNRQNWSAGSQRKATKSTENGHARGSSSRKALTSPWNLPGSPSKSCHARPQRTAMTETPIKPPSSQANLVQGLGLLDSTM